MRVLIDSLPLGENAREWGRRIAWTRLVCRGCESVGMTNREEPPVESEIAVPVVMEEEEEKTRQVREDGNPLGVAPGPQRGRVRRLETHARGEDLRTLARNARVYPQPPPPTLNPQEVEAAAAGGGGKTPAPALALAPVPLPVPANIV